jgi:cytochrome P450
MTDVTAEPALPDFFPWPRGNFDPPDLYAWCRENRPVTRVTVGTGRPAWLVTRYDDVRSILSDPRVSADSRLPGFPYYAEVMKRPDEERAFLRMDPPDHTVIRRMLAPNFAVKRVEALRPRIQQLVDDTIDHMLSLTQPVDLVKEFALPIPSTVLSWILGVRAEDAPFFNKASEEILGGSAGDPDGFTKAFKAYDALQDYIAGLVDEKDASADPGKDILGQMVLAAREGRCTRQDVINTGFTLAIAGHDTTASMSAMGVLTLLLHPEQLAELRAHPELYPEAIEELLRYLTVVHLIVQRVAAEDIDIGGTTIPAGEGILPLNLSANRDDAHYPGAATFDIHRGARDHFAFGYGIHQCIGQPLARVELNIIFETLFRRIPTLQLAAPVADAQFKLWMPIHGVYSLAVTW